MISNLYKIDFIDSKGNKFSTFSRDEKTIWEIYNMVCYGYEAVYMYDMVLEDLMCYHEKPTYRSTHYA